VGREAAEDAEINAGKTQLWSLMKSLPLLNQLFSGDIDLGGRLGVVNRMNFGRG